MIIKISRLRLRVTIGVYDWEKTAPREVLVNISMETANEKATESDALEHTVDYDALSSKIRTYAESRSFQLIEKLAGDLLRIVLENPLVKHSTVEIEKPGAVKFCDTVSVTVSGDRAE